jgi:hypothetical protein
MTRQLVGHCHCGAINVVLETAKTAAELPLRACQCSYCRTRGALTTSDPAGHLHLQSAPGAVTRYRFGLQVTDFILCAECGTYVAALSEIDGALMGVVNARGAQLGGFDEREPDPMIYDDESPDERLARRAHRWMPATLVEVYPNA